MHDKVVCKIADRASAQYQQLGIMPWHHIVIDGDDAFIYIWDTRIIELIIPVNCLVQTDLTYAVIDNRLDLICNDESSDHIKAKCQEHRESMPIMFVEGELTDDERSLLDINHY
jgi:hypothetical protein